LVLIEFDEEVENWEDWKRKAANFCQGGYFQEMGVEWIWQGSEFAKQNKEILQMGNSEMEFCSILETEGKGRRERVSKWFLSVGCGGGCCCWGKKWIRVFERVL